MGSIPKKGHTYGNLYITKAPTCTKDGYGYDVCYDCGAMYNGHVVSKEMAHNYVNVKGTDNYKCSKCGKVHVGAFG